MGKNTFGDVLWSITAWILRVAGVIFALSQVFVFAISPAFEVKTWINLLMGVGMIIWVISSIIKSRQAKDN